MFTKQDYLSIARIIVSTDWNGSSSVEKEGVCVTQFQGTIFPSAYQCFKVERGHDILVAKFTGYSEYSALKLFREDGLPVPSPISCVGNTSSCILLLEEFMPGIELSSDSPKELWREAGIQLANLHLKHWNPGTDDNTVSLQHGSDLYEEKWRSIVRSNYFNQKWRKLIQKLALRFNKAPQVIGHGDAFPTNFLIHDGHVCLVDLANAGVMPYMSDIARLTCLPELGGDALLCPCKEYVLDAYYQVVRRRLKLSEEDFLYDVGLASFIELAANYVPPVGIDAYSLAYKGKSNKVVEHMLCSLADKLS